MKRSMLRGSLLASILICCFVPSLWAATLQLKDGRLIQGKYLGGTEATINLLVNGKLERYPVSDVLVLDFGDTNTAAGATTNPAREAAAASVNPSPSDSITVPAGTGLVVRMIDSVDSDRNKVGDRFQASLEDALVVGDQIVAPKGTDVYGRLIAAKEAGHIEGQSELRLELTGMRIDQQYVAIVTGDYDVAGKSRGRNTAQKAAGGAALGAIIGAIAGGGKGAAIGAGVGAGAGTAVQVLTKGQQVHVPSETILEFTLQQPVSLPLSTSSAR